MTSIIIYTTEENLLHKQDKLKSDKDKSDAGIYYWTFSKFPKRLDYGRIYFATKGFIRGYFKVLDINRDDIRFGNQDPMGMPDNSVSWMSKTWKNIKPIPTKSFQGFKYADKVPELNDVLTRKQE